MTLKPLIKTFRKNSQKTHKKPLENSQKILEKSKKSPKYALKIRKNSQEVLTFLESASNLQPVKVQIYRATSNFDLHMKIFKIFKASRLSTDLKKSKQKLCLYLDTTFKGQTRSISTKL
jgi:hypothetical protein